MDFPRQPGTISWWQAHPYARAAYYALLYSAITMATACPLARLMYESLRQAAYLPAATTTIAQLMPSECALVYTYFFVFAYLAETIPNRRPQPQTGKPRSTWRGFDSNAQ